MAVNITVFPYLSPRVIQVDSPQTEATLQGLIDAIRDWEDDADHTQFDTLIDAAGKEDLGGGVTVGITATLQNAQLYFAPRSSQIVTGETVSTADADGYTLITTGATYITDGVQRGDIVYNVTTTAMATVLTVDSEEQISHMQLSGGSRNDWQVSDAVDVYRNEQCNISGGNLVAVDDVGASIPSTLQSPNTNIVRTSSSSATLQELADIQFSSFQGGVWIDVSGSNSGTTFPNGTARQPVNNFTDGLAIANARGFKRFFVIGDATIGGGLTFDNFAFVGEGPNLSTFTIDASASVVSCAFKNALVTGTLDGDSFVDECIVESLDFVSGVIRSSILNPGTITLGGAQIAHFIDCESGVPGAGTPTIDMGGTGQGLAVRGFNGGIKLTNHSGSDAVSLDFNSGQVRLDLATLTGGTIIARGTAKVVNDATGDHLPSGTYGGLTLVNETAYGLMLTEIWQTLGLDPDNPMTVTPTSRVAGSVSQTISGDGETTTTVTRT